MLLSFTELLSCCLAIVAEPIKNNSIWFRSTILIVIAHFLFWLPYNLSALLTHASSEYKEWVGLSLGNWVYWQWVGQLFVFLRTAGLNWRIENFSFHFLHYSYRNGWTIIRFRTINRNPSRMIALHAYFLNDLQVVITLINPLLYVITE